MSTPTPSCAGGSASPRQRSARWGRESIEASSREARADASAPGIDRVSLQRFGVKAEAEAGTLRQYQFATANLELSIDQAPERQDGVVVEIFDEAAIWHRGD